jgi:rod shape-determining protein MreD
MKPAFWQKLDLWARWLTPFGLTVVLLIFGIVPLHIPGLGIIVPWLPLMAVYHWAIYRPELLPAYAVFIIGVLEDILTGLPIGVNALIFLLVYGGVLSQRRFFVGKSFYILWIGFGLVAAAAAATNWLLVSLWNATILMPNALFFQFLTTVGLYPVLAWVFLRWQYTFLKED